LRAPIASSLLAVSACLALAPGRAGSAPNETRTSPAPAPTKDASLAEYFAELERVGLLDVATGSREVMTAEIDRAERLLREGAALEAAVALYAIVESPRFRGFDDFVEYQNAEYYLAVALANAGAFQSALVYLERVMERGPSTLYFAPAHRRAVDIALETRDHRAVLDRLLALKLTEPIPPGPAGERAYLRARIAYDAGDFRAAEGELAAISRRSRLFSSALYLRSVIRTRNGRFADAAEALCEIADTPDKDRFTFVVDDRYFTIKDLARLGLGRLAHETGAYDDAYYHYFQIPEDSERLPDALFEAAWSMYQKRELATARDLVAEFLDTFPSSPLTPEARLLAGYVELADCEFDASQAHYDRLVAELQPLVDEIERIRKDPQLRSNLFDRAMVRWRDERASEDSHRVAAARPDRTSDKVLALLRLDPEFVRLHEAVSGLRSAAGDAPHVVRAWSALGRRLGRVDVAKVAAERDFEEEEVADANALVEDVRRLRDEVERARAELRAGVRARTLPEDAAADEARRLRALGAEIDALEDKAAAAARAIDGTLAAGAPPGLAPLVHADLERARDVEKASRRLEERLAAAADRMAEQAIERLHLETRRVLDRAKLGKIDAVIGQKRRLEIEVQDLAAGRFPPELHGQLWEQGLIGDDEEYWPFEGEFWADEYEGWR
jgi:hypothetical protein